MEEINETYDNLTNGEILEQINKIGSTDVHVNNRKRLVRTLNRLKNNKEVEVSGNNLLYDNVYFIGLTTERSILYDRINKRVDEMVEEGLIEEVKDLYDKNINTIPINTAIGYKELYKYFDGNISLDESIELIKRNSRRYAKRQYTWINNKMNVKWFNVNINEFDKTISDIEEYIKNN